jgi:AcrR family transcriptional regulator
MATKSLTRAEQQERTRKRLISAARKVFARRGYHAAKLDEVASEASLSTGAVYSNFTGKEELFLAIAELEVGDRLREIRAVADAVERGAMPSAVAAAEFGKFIERDRDWPLLFYEFWSFGVRDTRLQKEFHQWRVSVRDVLAETLERVANHFGVRLRFPSHQLASALGAAINGMAFERAADPDGMSDELFGEFVAALLGCAVAAEDRSRLPSRT